MLKVCMYVWGNIHTLFSEVTRYLAGIPCLPPHLGMYVCMYGPKLKVCMYVWGHYIPMYVCRGKHTYLETIGMYV